MGYLVAAYAVLWAISFGLVLSMVMRQRKLESDLRTLKVTGEEDIYPGQGD